MRARALLAIALTTAVPAAGCAFAVDHPAVTAGVLGGTLGFGTCKLASDSYGTCAAVGGGAGAFLALVAATAIWLGGEGHTVLMDEQAQPLPEDSRPARRRKPAAPDAPPAEPSAPPATPAPDAEPSPPPGALPAPPPASPAPVAPQP